MCACTCVCVSILVSVLRVCVCDSVLVCASACMCKLTLVWCVCKLACVTSFADIMPAFSDHVECHDHSCFNSHYVVRKEIIRYSDTWAENHQQIIVARMLQARWRWVGSGHEAITFPTFPQPFHSRTGNHQQIFVAGMLQARWQWVVSGHEAITFPQPFHSSK